MLSTLTDKGQITLPKPIRDRLGIEPGAKLAFELQADNTIRVRVLARGSANLFGLLAKPGERARSLDEMDAGIGAAAKARAKPRAADSGVQALDTNLLVRLFVADDAVQAAQVRTLFDRHAAEEGAFWIADTVLVELAWTLERSYGRSRDDVALAMRALGDNATVSLESPASVAQAVALYETQSADFADCLLAAKAAAAGCESLRTFDKKMKSLPGVKLL